MTDFLPIVSHFAVSYLHLLLSYRFYSRRHEDSLIFIFWMCMTLWAFMHGLMGSGLLLEVTGNLNAIHYSTKLLNQIFQAYMLAMFVPLLIGELSEPPSKPNFISSVLMFIPNHSTLIFRLMLALATLQVLLMLSPFYPSELLRHSYGNEYAGQAMLVMGAIWFLMIISGIRPSAQRGKDFSRALRLPFAIMFLLCVGLFMGGFWERHWSLFPIISSLAFSFSFSWFFFRLQFLDMILNQSVSILVLITASIGLGYLINMTTFPSNDTLQYLVIGLYLSATLIGFRLITNWFARLWLPSEKTLNRVHAELPARLSRCENAQSAIKETEQFVSSTFNCKVSINRKPSFEAATMVAVAGEPKIVFELGYMRGWVPWFSQASSWAQTAAMYLQAHLNILISHERSIKNEELSALAARSELNAMRAQIRPHFLFNTLNSIHSFVREDPDQAETVIEKLSDLMRCALTTPDSDVILLEKEMETVQNYLSIEKARYGNRLVYDISIPDQFLSWRVPPFSIQPLVENAIKHGLENHFGPVNIQISAEIAESVLTISVDDNGGGLKSEKKGLGLATKNISDRLVRLYGNSAGLALVTNERSGVTAILTLPAISDMAQLHD